MAPNDRAVAVEGMRRFLKLHATCYGVSIDTPELPRPGHYRVVIACRCGHTIEYWLDDAVLPRQQIIAALTGRPAA